MSGPGNSEGVTDEPVQPGSYDLSESGGPDNYSASDWTCDGGVLTGSTVDIALGDDVTCTIINTAQPPEWTLAKSSNPASGTTVDPGDEITYTITATKLAGVDPTNVVVTDDLSAVLNNATLVAGSITTSTGTAELSGNQLVWSIPTLSGEETLSYTVRVNDGANNVQLVNVVTGTGPTPPDVCAPGSSLAQAATRTITFGTTSLTIQLVAAVVEPCSTNHRTTPPPPPPPPPPIPFTGSNVMLLLILSAAGTTAGALTVAVARRRRLAG